MTQRVVMGRVTTVTGEPVRGARVEISTNGGTKFVSIATGPQGEFRTDYTLTVAPKEFIVTLTVTKKGYPAAHAYANYGSSGKPFPIMVLLRQPLNDPTLLSEADLISGLAPRLRTLGPSDGLSAKDLKTYERAAGEFLDKNRLDLAVPDLEKVAASNPSCLRCRVMLTMADMRWGDWVNAQNHLAESLNAAIANRKLSIAEPLLGYGVWMSWQHHPDKAEPYLLEAVKDAPKDALALQELGRIESLIMNWEEAEIFLRNALAAGAGPEARLLHAEALVWAGTVNEAAAELSLYLEGRDIKKMPPRVQGIWQKIQERKKDDNALVKLQKQAAPYVDYVHNPPSEFQKMDPAGDEVKLDSLLTAVGKNVADLYQNFPNTISLEKIHQEKLDRKGKSAGSLDQKFHYLCLMPLSPWGAPNR